VRTEHRSQKDLVADAAKGDRAAFRELLDTYHDRVFRFASARLASSEEAQDVVQEVFLAVWRGLPRFHYEHEGSFPGWIFGIARNVVGTHLRQRGRATFVPLEDEADPPTRFEERIESQQVLLAALDKLPELQREVLVMRFVAGLSTREVGEATGRSEGAVASLQMRGLARMRKALGGIELEAR
jgi:RNA polymerase sigma-70 factor (ECF subfamily)